MAHMRNSVLPARRRGKVILAIILILILGGAAYLLRGVFFPSLSFGSTVELLTDTEGNREDKAAVQMEKLENKGYQYNSDMINILLLGIDTDENREAKHLGWRSDVMIVAALNTKTKDVKLISIPRDTYAQVNRLNAEGQIESTQKNKINAAFAFGGGAAKYSYPNTVDAVRNLMFGIPIHGYMGVDMDGFEGLVDSLGGVTLKITDDMSAVDKNFPKKGSTATLSGKQALLYVRERKSTPGGDTGRSRRQRELLTAIMEEGQRQGMVSFTTKCLSSMSDDITTSLSADQILSLAAILGSGGMDEVESITLEGKYGRSESNASIFLLDEEKLEALVCDTWMEKK